MKSHRALMAVAILASAITLTSCRATRPVVETSTRDSVERFTTVVKRDTTLIAPAAAIGIELSVKDLLNALKTPGAIQGKHDTAVPDFRHSVAFIPGFYRQGKDKQATVSARTSADGQRLLIGCNCDTLAITAELRDRYDRERVASVTIKTEKVPVPYVPWYVAALAWIGGLCLLIVLIGFISKRFLPARLP